MTKGRKIIEVNINTMDGLWFVDVVYEGNCSLTVGPLSKLALGVAEDGETLSPWLALNDDEELVDVQN